MKYNNLRIYTQVLFVFFSLLGFILLSLVLGALSDLSQAKQVLPPIDITNNADNWSIYLYAIPDSNGTEVHFFAEGLGNSCTEGVVTFVAHVDDVITAPATPVPGEDKYIASVDPFFVACENPPCTQVDTKALELECEGTDLSSRKVSFNRFYASSGMETSIYTEDRNAELVVSPNTLDENPYIITMETVTWPGRPPTDAIFREGVFPYTFRASGGILTTETNMSLSLDYGNSLPLTDVDPFTLRIFEWDNTNEQWLINNRYTLFTDFFAIKILTKEFTTYIVGITPYWYDSFGSDLGLDTTKMYNIDRLLADDGKLKLTPPTSGTLFNPPRVGYAISKPITPTMPIISWESITYTTGTITGTANITVGTALTISVLSGDGGTVLETNVSPGQAITTINPISYPVLRLRVDMASMSTNSPELLGWGINAKPKVYGVYLPLVFK